MKKLVFVALLGALLVGPLGLAAAQAASPAAPRAGPAAQRAVPVSTTQAAASGFCFQLAKSSNRWWCVFGGTPTCPNDVAPTRIFGIDGLLSYWRCGFTLKPPTPGGCLNIAGTTAFTCLGRAKPAGTCTEGFSILIVHRYHCGATFPRLASGILR